MAFRMHGKGDRKALNRTNTQPVKPPPVHKGSTINIFTVEKSQSVIRALQDLQTQGYDGKAVMRISTSRSVEGRYQWKQPQGTQQEPLILEGTTANTIWKGSLYLVTPDKEGVTHYPKIQIELPCLDNSNKKGQPKSEPKSSGGFSLTASLRDAVEPKVVPNCSSLESDSNKDAVEPKVVPNCSSLESDSNKDAVEPTQGPTDNENVASEPSVVGSDIQRNQNSSTPQRVLPDTCNGATITIYPKGFPTPECTSTYKMRGRLPNKSKPPKSYWETKGDAYDFTIGDVDPDGLAATLAVHFAFIPNTWFGRPLDVVIRRPTISLTLGGDWIIKGDSNTVLIMRNMIINLGNKRWTIDRINIVLHNVIITGGEYPDSNVKINNGSLISGSAEPNIAESSHAGVFVNNIIICSNLGRMLLYNSILQKCKLFISDARIADTIIKECVCKSTDDSLLVEFHNTELRGGSSEFLCTKIIARSVRSVRSKFVVRQSTIILCDVTSKWESSGAPRKSTPSIDIPNLPIEGWLLEGCRGRCTGTTLEGIECHQCDIGFTNSLSAVMAENSNLYVEFE